MQMIFGMPYLLEMSSIRECVMLCREMGLSFVELNANFPQCQLSRMNPDELHSLKRETGVDFTLHIEEECDPFAFNQSVRTAWLDTVEKSLRFALELHMPIVNMHMPHGVYITLPDRKTFLYKQYAEEFHAALKVFRDLCKQILTGTDTRIVIENTDGWMPHEREAIEYLLDSDVFGLTLDIGHSHGVENADEAFFRKHDERLLHMHGHDAIGRRNHLALGTGEIDLRERFAWAKRRNARIVLETKTIAALRESTQILPQIVAKI